MSGIVDRAEQRTVSARDSDRRRASLVFEPSPALEEALMAELPEVVDPFRCLICHQSEDPGGGAVVAVLAQAQRTVERLADRLLVGEGGDGLDLTDKAQDVRIDVLLVLGVVGVE